LGYSFDALPYNYLDTPPSDLSVVQKNLDLLIDLMKGESNHELWLKLEEFLEETTDEVYVVLDSLLASIEFLLAAKSRNEKGKRHDFIDL
jgi:hypothetical protein